MRTKVFISYSHKDASWLDRMRIHLKPLERVGLIDCWDDSRIDAGQAWRVEIERALASARVAILLLSPDFLASDFVHDVELPALLEAAEQRGLVVIQVCLRPTNLALHPKLAARRMLNGTDRPLNGLAQVDQDRCFVDLSNQLLTLAAAHAGITDDGDSIASESAAGGVPLMNRVLAGEHEDTRAHFTTAFNQHVARLRTGGQYRQDRHISRSEIEAELMAFRDGHRPVYYFVGASGAGKTELLIRFGEWAASRGDLVLFADLASAASEDTVSRQGLERVLSDLLGMGQGFTDVTHSVFQANLKLHRLDRIVVIFDQFDRLVGADYSQCLLFKAICDLAKAYSEVRFVLPVREETHTILFEDAGQFSLKPDPSVFFLPIVRSPNRPDYLQRWVAYLPLLQPDEVDAALARVAEEELPEVRFDRLSPAWQKLLATPIHLGNFIELCHRRHRLPRCEPTAEALYSEFVDALPPQLRKLTYNLAVFLKNRGRVRASESEIVEMTHLSIGSSFDKLRPLFEELAQAGIIRPTLVRSGRNTERGIELAHDRTIDWVVQGHQRVVKRMLTRSFAITGTIALLFFVGELVRFWRHTPPLHTISAAVEAINLRNCEIYGTCVEERHFLAQLGIIQADSHNLPTLIWYVAVTLFLIPSFFLGWLLALSDARREDSLEQTRDHKGHKRWYRAADVLCLFPIRRAALKWVASARYFFISLILSGAEGSCLARGLGAEGASRWSWFSASLGVAMLTLWWWARRYMQIQAELLSQHLPDEAARLAMLLTRRWYSLRPFLSSLFARCIGMVALIATLQLVAVGYISTFDLVTRYTDARVHAALEQLSKNGVPDGDPHRFDVYAPLADDCVVAARRSGERQTRIVRLVQHLLPLFWITMLGGWAFTRWVIAAYARRALSRLRQRAEAVPS